MESIGFKEWALVCEALGRGEQTILLRKGGIAEGRAGFAFRHEEFFLLPTFFHEQVGKTRSRDSVPERRAGEIEIRFFARVEISTVLTTWETALAIEPFHILQREVVRERFEYAEPKGVHVAFVRVFRLEPNWILADEPRYGGCRSWVKLPAHPRATSFRPVIPDEEHARRFKNFQNIISP